MTDHELPPTSPPDPGWPMQVASAIDAAARTGRPFQAADLGRLYDLPDPPHPWQWGRAFSAAHARGVIRKVGAATSLRRTVAASLVHVWVGVDDRLPAAHRREAS